VSLARGEPSGNTRAGEESPPLDLAGRSAAREFPDELHVFDVFGMFVEPNDKRGLSPWGHPDSEPSRRYDRAQRFLTRSRP